MRGGVLTGLGPSATGEVFVRLGGGESEGVNRVSGGTRLVVSGTAEVVPTEGGHVGSRKGVRRSVPKELIAQRSESLVTVPDRETNDRLMGEFRRGELSTFGASRDCPESGQFVVCAIEVDDVRLPVLNTGDGQLFENTPEPFRWFFHAKSFFS